MKKYLSSALKVLAIGVVLYVIYAFQGEIFKSENHQKIEVPELLQRGDKIQNGKEWDYVQNQFSDQVQILKTKPDDATAKLQLAQLFIKEARVTGEHGHYYPAALKMLNEVLAQKEVSKDMEFLALMHKAGVELSLHDFSQALETGTKAALLNPANAQVHGVLVDANVELGNYSKAIALADRMISIKPDIRSYSRVSYLREIHGDVEGSIEALTMAVKSGYPGYEETAWAMQTLGDLFVRYGRLEDAERVYNEILAMRPDYPFAVAGLANIYHLNGNDELAEKTYIDAIAIIPEVGFYISLAEMYKEQGRMVEMNMYIKEILPMLEDDEKSGHNMNLEYAHIYLELLEDVDMAQKYADLEYKKRPENIDVNLMMATIMERKTDRIGAKPFLLVAGKTNSQNPDYLKMKEVIQG